MASTRTLDNKPHPCSLKTYCLAKARNGAHEAKPAVPSNVQQELSSLRIMALGNKAHETSASLTYTLLGSLGFNLHAPDLFRN